MNRKSLIKDKIDFSYMEINGIPCIYSEEPIDRTSIPNGFVAYDIYGNAFNKMVALINEWGSYTNLKGSVIFEIDSIDASKDLIKIFSFSPYKHANRIEKKLTNAIHSISTIIS